MSSITVLERKKNDIDLAVMSYSYAYSSCVENERLKHRNIGRSATQHVQQSLKSFKQQWVMYKLENCFSCFCEGKKYANQLTFARVDGVINAKINYNMDNNNYNDENWKTFFAIPIQRWFKKVHAVEIKVLKDKNENEFIAARKIQRYWRSIFPKNIIKNTLNKAKNLKDFCDIASAMEYKDQGKTLLAVSRIIIHSKYFKETYNFQTVPDYLVKLVEKIYSKVHKLTKVWNNMATKSNNNNNSSSSIGSDAFYHYRCKIGSRALYKIISWILKIDHQNTSKLSNKEDVKRIYSIFKKTMKMGDIIKAGTTNEISIENDNNNNNSNKEINDGNFVKVNNQLIDESFELNSEDSDDDIATDEVLSSSDDDDDDDDDNDMPKYRVGDRIEAKVSGWKKYYGGEVIFVNEDDETYDLKFDNGERKRGVDVKYIRQIGEKTSKSEKKSKIKQKQKKLKEITWSKKTNLRPISNSRNDFTIGFNKSSNNWESVISDTKLKIPKGYNMKISFDVPDPCDGTNTWGYCVCVGKDKKTHTTNFEKSFPGAVNDSIGFSWILLDGGLLHDGKKKDIYHQKKSKLTKGQNGYIIIDPTATTPSGHFQCYGNDGTKFFSGGQWWDNGMYLSIYISKKSALNLKVELVSSGKTKGKKISSRKKKSKEKKKTKKGKRRNKSFDQAKFNAVKKKHGNNDDALVKCCKDGTFDEAKLLIDGGMDVNRKAPTIYDNTALTRAAASGKLEICKYLLNECGADVNLGGYKNRSALIMCCWEGHENIVKFFLEQPDIEVTLTRPDETGVTPLSKAKTTKIRNLVQFRIDNKPKKKKRLTKRKSSTKKRSVTNNGSSRKGNQILDIKELDLNTDINTEDGAEKLLDAISRTLILRGAQNLTSFGMKLTDLVDILSDSKTGRKTIANNTVNARIDTFSTLTNKTLLCAELSDDGKKVIFVALANKTDAVKFEYRGKTSTAGSWTKLSATYNATEKLWKSSTWSKGNTQYHQRLSINGEVVDTTDEAEALSRKPMSYAEQIESQKVRNKIISLYRCYDPISLELVEQDLDELDGVKEEQEFLETLQKEFSTIEKPIENVIDLKLKNEWDLEEYGDIEDFLRDYREYFTCDGKEINDEMTMSLWPGSKCWSCGKTGTICKQLHPKSANKSRNDAYAKNGWFAVCDAHKTYNPDASKNYGPLPDTGTEFDGDSIIALKPGIADEVYKEYVGYLLSKKFPMKTKPIEKKKSLALLKAEREQRQKSIVAAKTSLKILEIMAENLKKLKNGVDQTDNSSNAMKIFFRDLFGYIVCTVIPTIGNEDKTLIKSAEWAIIPLLNSLSKTNEFDMKKIEPFMILYFHPYKTIHDKIKSKSILSKLNCIQKFFSLHSPKVFAAIEARRRLKIFIKRLRVMKKRGTIGKIDFYEIWNAIVEYKDEEENKKNKSTGNIDDTNLKLAIEGLIQTTLRRRAPEIRKEAAMRLKEDESKRASMHSKSAYTQRIINMMGFRSREADKIGDLCAMQEKLVGFEEVKSFCNAIVEDALGRNTLNENRPLRHVLISGNPGTGKRTAAYLFAKWFYYTQAKKKRSLSKKDVKFPAKGSKCKLAKDYKKDKEAEKGPLKPGEIAVIETGSTHSTAVTIKGWSYKVNILVPVVNKAGECINIYNIDDLEEQIETNDEKFVTFYWSIINPDEVKEKKTLMKVSALLTMALAKQIRVIIGAHDVVIQRLAPLPCYRAFEASVMKLPILSSSNLAKISLMRLEEKGYSLAADDDRRNRLSTMKRIVRSKYDSASIQARNAYLADDCIELAISRKNRRILENIEERNDYDKAPLVLTVTDFDVKTTTAQERDRLRKDIDEKIESMLGWGVEEEHGTPRWWFARMRELIEQAENDEHNLELEDILENTSISKSQDDQKDDLAPPKIKLKRSISYDDEAGIQTSSLRPWEFNTIIEGNEGVGKSLFAQVATEFLFAYSILPTNKMMKQIGQPSMAFDTLKKTDGALLIAQAEKIMPNLQQAANNLDAPLDAGANIAEHATKPNTFIALSCPVGSAIGTLNSHVDLKSKVPFSVKMPDPEIYTLVLIATKYCAEKRGVYFEKGLDVKLKKYLEDTYSSKPEGGVRFIQQLVDQALLRRSERRAAHQTGQKASICLIPSDFEIGKELGDPEEIKKIMDEVNGLIGMSNAKEWLEKIKKNIEFVNITGDRRTIKRCYNLVLTGAPGTGKTTFARMVHKFLKAHGVLTGEFIEKNALELKGEYVGSTTPLVKACFKDAKNGTLFLDEAYSLASENGGSGDIFSKEAVRTLLTETENNRTGTVVIMAGYEDKMKRFMREDPGLPRRFPEYLHLENYSTTEIADIAEYVAQTRYGRQFEDGLKEKLAKHVGITYRRQIEEQNGGLAVNLVQDANKEQQNRLLNSITEVQGVDRKQQLLEAATILTAEDFGIAELGKGTLGAGEMLKAEAEEKVGNLVSMVEVKKFFAKMKNTAKFVEKTGNSAPLFSCMNLVLMGNAGTGKSTTARIIGEYLYAYGILQSGTFHEVNALHLKGQYMGQTAHRVSEIVKDALGGCLFIDEAYSLVSDGGDSYGREVVRTLLTEVENHRSELLVILAGYEGPMENLLDADPGLRRRFSTRLLLPNYSGKELAKIAKLEAKRKGLLFEEGLEENLGKYIEFAHFDDMEDQNGGLAVNLVERALERLADRLINQDLPDEEIRKLGRTFTAADFDIDFTKNISTTMKKKRSSSRKHGCKHNACDVSDNNHNHNYPRNQPVAPNSNLTVFAPPILTVRTRPPRVKKTPGGGGSNSRVKEAPTQEQVEEEYEEEEEEEEEEDRKEMTEAEALEKLKEIGVCPQSYQWIRGIYENQTCQKCNCPFNNGYRCAGGTHYVCISCVNSA